MHSLLVDPRVSGGVLVPLVDQSADRVVQPVFSGEQGATAILELWEVNGFEAIAVANFAHEIFPSRGWCHFVRGY